MGTIDSQSEHQQEHQIEYGVSMIDGYISTYSLKVGNCLEMIGPFGTRYVFEVTKKIKIKGFEDHEEFEKYDVYIKCIYGKGSLRDAAGIIVSSDGRISIGERLCIGDTGTRTSNLKEMIVWETTPNMEDIPSIEYGEWLDWLDTRALVDGDHVSCYARDGGFYVFRIEGEDEETGKLLFRLMYMDYQDPGGDSFWKGGAIHGEILASNFTARVGDNIRIGQLDSIRVTKDFPEEDLDPPKNEKPANPFLPREAVMSQVGITQVELGEILQPIFSETEQKVLRILGFSTDLSLITDPSELLKDAQAYYLEKCDKKISTSDDLQRAELEILRDTVIEGVASILGKLNTS